MHAFLLRASSVAAVLALAASALVAPPGPGAAALVPSAGEAVSPPARLAAEPTDDGIVPGYVGEVGAISLSDADGVLQVDLEAHGQFDAAVPGPEGTPVAYAVEVTSAHNGLPITYRLAYDYSTGVFALPTVEQGHRFLLYTHSEPNTTNPGLVSYCSIPADLSGSTATLDGAIRHITWRIDLAEMNVDTKPAQGACPADGNALRGGRGLETGDLLTHVLGAATAKAVTLTLGDFQDTATAPDYPVVGVGDPCASDTAAPAISGIAVEPGATSATVAWTTDEVSSSLVAYGATASYGATATGPGGTSAHAVRVSGLSPSTEYHFQVLSEDPCGNLASSADGTFTTDAGSGGTEPFVAIDSPADGAVVDGDALDVSGRAGLRATGGGGDANGDGFVVIAIPDTGVNPYHDDFSGQLYPRNTDADPDNDVDFRAYPGDYLDGFPGGVAALDLTIDGSFNAVADTAQFAAVPMFELRWIPGTKIIGAIDTSNAAPVNGNGADTLPILDQDGHGTASASVAAGNFDGSCPECLLVVIEGIGGDEWAFTQPWIDIVSTSGGSPLNLPTTFGVEAGHMPTVPGQRDAAERGQTLLYAAGNGCLAWVCPEQTYLSQSTGPAWTLDIGALIRGESGEHESVLMSGKPVTMSSFAVGSIPAACRTGTEPGECQHSGTSAATPRTAGHFGNVLLRARSLLGDGDLGTQRVAGTAVVASGTAVPASPYLADGQLTRAELWDILFHAAQPLDPEPLGTVHFYPAGLPGSPVDYAYAGYGVADDAMEALALAMLAGEASGLDKADAEAFFEVDRAIRDRLWGTWDDDADTVPSAGATASSSPPTLPELGLPESFVPASPADVDTLVAAVGAYLDRQPPAEAPLAPTLAAACTGLPDAAAVTLLLDGAEVGSVDLADAAPGEACEEAWAIPGVDVAGLANGPHTLTAEYARGGTVVATHEVAFTVDRQATLQFGEDTDVAIAGEDEVLRLVVPDGADLLSVAMSGPACPPPPAACGFDVDLYVRHASVPTDTEYDCRPFLAGNTEACDLSAPQAGEWFVRLAPYEGSGSGTVTLRADLDLPDTDGDGVPDARDPDRDGDNLDDALEGQLGTDPDEPLLVLPGEAAACTPKGKPFTADRDGDGVVAVYVTGPRTAVGPGGASSDPAPTECWLAGDPDDDGQARLPSWTPLGICPPSKKVGKADRDGDGVPALYTAPAQCWLAGDLDDDGTDRALLAAGAPAVGPAAAPAGLRGVLDGLLRLI